MKTLEELKQDKRIIIQEIGSDGGYAYAYLNGSRKPAMIVFSWGGGWDHVSVSYKNRCCTWDEMCTVKYIFFRDDECVVQYHPKKADYINNHPYVLHLWKKQGEEFPMPPKYMV